jgi:predicted transcriptional regulator
MTQNTFRKTIIDKRLEELSDKVRRGTPILMSEAIEVVEYQEMLKKNKVPFTDRIVNFFKIKK